MLICPLLRGRCSVNCLFNSCGTELTQDKKEQCVLYGAVQFLNTFYRESVESDEFRARGHFADLISQIRNISVPDDDNNP